MRKEIKNFNKVVGTALIVLTVISLVINALNFTYAIYNTSYDVTSLNQLLISVPFKIVLWIDNILIYVFGLLYIIDAIKSKKDVVLRISLSVFSIFTTIILATFIINLIASLFGIF